MHQPQLKHHYFLFTSSSLIITRQNKHNELVAMYLQTRDHIISRKIHVPLSSKLLFALVLAATIILNGADAFTLPAPKSLFKPLNNRQKQTRVQRQRNHSSLQYLSTNSDENAKRENKNKEMPVQTLIRKAIQTSTSLATMVLLFGCSIPAGANGSFGSSLVSPTLLSSADPAGNVDVSNLIKSLQPATANRPQIPFPTQEALQRAAAEAASSGQSERSIQNPLKQPQYPIPQENLLKENSFSLPALVSMESYPRGAPRPYNGADILVLQVWTDKPDSDTSIALGGAKIPISAVVGGFPVRVSLGPQNALVKTTTIRESTATTTTAAAVTSDEAAIKQWKDYLSSQSLWVRAAICRGSENNSSSGNPSQQYSPPICPPDYHPKPVMEGIGFSKFIDLSSVMTNAASESRVQLQPQQGANGGLRAPVSLVLTTVPR